MTLDKANELLATQVLMGGGYNRNNDAQLILTEVQHEHGQQAVDSQIGAPNWKEFLNSNLELNSNVKSLNFY